ncbi:MAG: HAD family hydrolase [Kiritimatiellae bacterium]|nr:HAD family hydrolase [Kiritimatiellia bacterium]
MTRTFVFDMDGTLYDDVPVYPAAAEAAFEIGARLSGVPGETFAAAVKRAFDWQFSTYPEYPGVHGRFTRFQRAMEDLGKPPVLGLAVGNRYWEKFLETVRPRPDAAALLADLRARGVRVGLGTNMSADWQLAKLERLGLGQYFDFVVSSEEAAAEKPSPAFFDMVAEKSRCERSEILFCGDNPDLDARAAKAVGMRGVWLAAGPDCKPEDAPDVEAVKTLGDLRGLVPEIFAKP